MIDHKNLLENLTIKLESKFIYISFRVWTSEVIVILIRIHENQKGQILTIVDARNKFIPFY